MPQTTSATRVSTLRLILIPAVITLAITLLRLIGELQGWSSALFNREAGGRGAIIGIAWLAPVFGVYFAIKLAQAGQGPEDKGRAVRLAIFGTVLLAASMFLVVSPQLNFPGKQVLGLLLMVIAVAFQYPGWPALFKTLLAYGYAARIPVVVIMFLAMRGNWGTHYDAVRPEYADLGFWSKFIQLGVLPQLILWIAFTIISGALFGSIAHAIKHKDRSSAQAARA